MNIFSLTSRARYGSFTLSRTVLEDSDRKRLLGKPSQAHLHKKMHELTHHAF